MKLGKSTKDANLTIIIALKVRDNIFTISIWRVFWLISAKFEIRL